MTKYVLNSGGIMRQPDLKRGFHRELVKDLGEAPKFLICLFTKPREYWERQYQGWCDGITGDMPEGVTPTFEMAMPADFVAQCERADVIYGTGGDSELLEYWWRQYDLPALFRGKVVVGNSASSYMLAKHYWTSDWRECKDGFGILPIKFIGHYLSNFVDDDPRGPLDWQKAYDALAAYGDTSLPICALKEGEFVVIEQ